MNGENESPGASVVQYSWVIDPDEYNQRWNFEQAPSGWRICVSPKFNGFYAALDKDCERLAEREVHVGTFEPLR